jgi:RecA-family ATPase
MMKEGTAAVQTSTVREFLQIISDQAKAATAGLERPGLLQMSRLHPTSEQLVPSRFLIGDVEHMVGVAVSDSEAGHNVYIEGRTVREDLRGGARGTLADTRAVFAIIVDSDADKEIGWQPTVPPSMTVETSPGNFQFWFFLREAVTAEIGKALGERIRAATRTDHDTGNVVQPYRVAGTVNYPNAKKIERGRVTVPTQLVEFDPEQLPELEQVFPLPEASAADAAQGDGQGDGDLGGIPADTLAVIRDGSRQGDDRSHVFWNVIVALKRAGWSIDGIAGLLEQYPYGIARKYRGRLRQEVERIYRKIRDNAQEMPKRAVGQASCAGALKTMIFAAIKYVVPGIIVEGLTLLAGKPKVGKSWLLLHAAIAVARGGFTLGDVHCVEGDVLYCALEDNERRLQSRITKLMGFSQPWPERLFYYCELPRLTEGGLDAIRAWIVSKPNPRLVIIDTLAMVRATRKREETNYESDYMAVLELRALANEFGIAIVLVHHLRKADSDDAYDTVSGTLGLTGAPDSILVLKRDSSGSMVLHGRGRDLVEIEKAMAFDADACLWRIAGDATAVRRSRERNVALDAIVEAKEPIGPNDVAAATGMRAANVRYLLGKLVEEGLIEKVSYGKYRMRGAAAAQSVTRGDGVTHVKQSDNAGMRTARARSDDMPYTGPTVEVPDQGADPLDDHGVPRRVPDGEV